MRIEPVDERTLHDWREVHNVIIPNAALSVEEVRERIGQNHLTVAYVDDTLVGCATVRPPAGPDRTATVIVRVLAAHRRRGYGQRFYESELARAYELGAGAIETVVLVTNVDGVRFAQSRAFVEVDRYFPEDGSAAFLTMRLDGGDRK
ncbi:GNAT family N-acetyltransferase [Fodinicola feengrottensis]